MCGIAGIYGKNPKEFNIREMVGVQRHRGPDAEGYYEGENISLGHCRLKVLDLSQAGNQPMRLPGKDIWISHNGEIYNYLELKEELSGEVKFRTATDTEVLLRAYEKWGLECLNHLEGMFSFAIWDDHKQRLFCARDHFGIKPFYYCWHKGHLFFSSEIKALLLSGIPREVEEKTLFDYLYYGYYEHSDKSFFKGIMKLEPGHCLTIEKNNGCRITKYWDLPSEVETTPGLTDKQVADTFFRLLEKTVKIHCRSDVPVGILLSGGLDSSALLSLVKRVYKPPLYSYSFVFNDSKYDETPFIRKVADEFNAIPRLAETTADEFWADLQEMTWHEEEPFGGLPTSAYNNMYKSASKDKVVVLLEGGGIDELLGGYNTHYIAYLKDLLLEDESAANKELDIYCSRSKINKRFLYEKLKDKDDASLYLLSNDATLSNNRGYLGREFSLRHKDNPPCFDLRFENNLRKLMYRDLRYTKLPRGLRFNDRNSMRFGRELRVPFLSRELVKFCYGLAPEYLFRDGQNKYLLRKNALLLPEGIRSAPKRYVQSPQREWFGGQLKDRIWELINSARFKKRPYFEHSKVIEGYRQYCNGFNNENSFFIWQWINLELWLRVFIDPAEISACGRG